MKGLPAGAERLAGDTWYLAGPTNSGAVDGVLIDTGCDESAYEGRSFDRLLITHGHADHFACGAYLRRAGTLVHAPRDDASLVENPEVNIRGMFSWAKPGDLLVTRLFRGEACHVDGLVELWSDPRVSAVPLHGHTLGHTGFLTADGVLFTGDALYQTPIWERHPLPYCIDPAMVAASLEHIRSTTFDVLVPGHGVPCTREEAEAHVDHHLGELRSIEELLVDRLKVEHTTEEAIALVSAERGLGDNAAQYWLAVTTVKGFLGGLLGRGEIEFFVRDHAGWWKTA